jgi:sporulation protein YlmC with PRC-barrel domain
MTMETTETLPRTDTSSRKPHSLIASDRVEGTPVRRSDGKKIGTIERLMIDKLSGNVAYAVLSFGGILGMGQKHLPVPWSRMQYNLLLEAYEINLTDEELAKAPSYAADREFDWGNRPREEEIHRYYGARTYWGAY